MTSDKHIKYGGLKFHNNVSPEDINRFVRELPAEKRESLYEVVKELESNGLITVEENSWSTIDDEMQPFME